MDQPARSRTDRKFSPDQVREIRQQIAMGIPRTRIARDRGVTVMTIRNIEQRLVYKLSLIHI